MGIGEFLLWIEKARVEERCDAARSIARTVLQSDLDLDERCIAEAALAMLLDDPSPRVRRAISDVLSLSAFAPQQILHALALDQHDVSAPVIIRSELNDETLIEALRKGDKRTAVLIADRPNVSRKLALAIADCADTVACLALATNGSARCDDAILARMIDRHGASSADLRGALLMDARLSLASRQRLIDMAGRALCASPLVRALIGETRAAALSAEAAADAPLMLVEHAEPETLPAYVRSLREAGRLTASLIMKALVFGRIDFVASIMSDLSGRTGEQVRAVLVRGGEAAIRAILKDVGLKGLMLDLAWRALSTWRDIAAGRIVLGRQELAWQLMRHAEAAERGHENDDLAGFMRRIYLEIARGNAQEHARGIAREARDERMVLESAAATLETEFMAMLDDISADIAPAEVHPDDLVLEIDIMPSGNSMQVRAPVEGFADDDAEFFASLDRAGRGHAASTVNELAAVLAEQYAAPARAA